MKRLFTNIVICLILMPVVMTMAQNDTKGPVCKLHDQEIEIAIDGKGNLVELKNLKTGHDYAGGMPLWRLYFDRKDGQKENEVLCRDNVPEIQQEKNCIKLKYGALKSRDGEVKMRLVLTVRLEKGQIRFGSEVSNNEPHTIIRELHYPLVTGCQLPADHK